ncbi:MULTISPECIES: cation diffusion facilitator family transporter [Aliagarivorans]|uniref:cation diffusion facilitator family transporter n=1 Tax=Aliagarivorans TaxID=882379 RepID=UPI00040AB83A|nr:MULTISPECIES: cation diffusion facilitator family transporter [Aliagarivorans]
MTTLKIIRKTTLVGSLANIMLAIMKIGAGVVSGSQALVADGVHSFSDLLTDLAVLVGAQFWTRPADDDHPYGHQRYETLTNVVIGAVLIVVALGIVGDSIARIGQGQGSSPSHLALLAAVLSIVTKEVLYRWTMKHAKQIRSSALSANAWHHRSDAFSSLPVLVSVLAANFVSNELYLDQIAAIVVAVMIIKSAVEIVWPSLTEILEQSAGEHVIEHIHELAAKHDDIREIHALRTRRIGGQIFVDFHLLVDAHLSIQAAHDISEGFNKEVLREVEEVSDVMIHIEPFNECESLTEWAK